MKLRTELKIEASDRQISHNHTLLLIGSCFSDNIGDLLSRSGFKIEHNPFGTVYNAASIYKQLRYGYKAQPLDEQLFAYNETDGLHRHYDFHSSFNATSKADLLQNIGGGIQKLTGLGQPSCCIITLGTSWVYQLKSAASLVANCHKMPDTYFDKQFLSLEDTVDVLQKIIGLLPGTRCIFTVSPVRHLKDGLVENARSKAVLLEAVHRICAQGLAEYFPAYELVMDDLRDYRFYENDLLHPSRLAVEYIWEKFCDRYMGEETKALVRKYNQLHQMMSHRPFQPDGEAYQKHLAKIEDLKREIESLRS